LLALLFHRGRDQENEQEQQGEQTEEKGECGRYTPIRGRGSCRSLRGESRL